MHGDWGHYGGSRENFLSLGKMKKLEELNIRVDEKNMLKKLPITRETRQRPAYGRGFYVDPTAQQKLTILRFPGITGLLTLTKINNVNFIKLVDSNGVETGGMVPGGALETQILPRLKPKRKTKRQK